MCLNQGNMGRGPSVDKCRQVFARDGPRKFECVPRFKILGHCDPPPHVTSWCRSVISCRLAHASLHLLTVGAKRSEEYSFLDGTLPDALQIPT